MIFHEEVARIISGIHSIEDRIKTDEFRNTLYFDQRRQVLSHLSHLKRATANLITLLDGFDQQKMKFPK